MIPQSEGSNLPMQAEKDFLNYNPYKDRDAVVTKVFCGI